MTVGNLRKVLRDQDITDDMEIVFVSGEDINGIDSCGTVGNNFLGVYFLALMTSEGEKKIEETVARNKRRV